MLLLNNKIIFFSDEGKILIDCDSRGRQEIHDHLLQVLGKTE